MEDAPEAEETNTLEAFDKPVKVEELIALDLDRHLQEVTVSANEGMDGEGPLNTIHSNNSKYCAHY